MEVHRARDQPAHAGDRARDVGGDHAGVGDDDDVAVEPVPVLRAADRAKFGEPDSSSPSIRNFRFTAGVVRPVAARWARRPSRWNSSWPLSSDGAPGATARRRRRSARTGRSATARSGRPAARRGARRPGRSARRDRRCGHSANTAGSPRVGQISTVGKPVRSAAAANHSGAAGNVGVVLRLRTDARDPQPLIQIGQQVGPVLSDEIPLERHARTVSRLGV